MSSTELDSVNALVARGKAKKDLRRPKTSRFCDHCQKPGHDKDQCFKIIGYPEWYEDLKGKKKFPGPRIAANVASYSNVQDTPLGEEPCVRGNTSKSHFDSNFIQALAQEVLKFAKGSQSSGQQFDAKEGGFAHFAGKDVSTGFSSICCVSQHGLHITWVVDTGASDHMSHDLTLFDKLEALSKPVSITLPDGSVQTVILGGNVRLDDRITLRRVLYVLGFKFNLLSVTKLLADQHLCIHIYPAECIFQDLTNNEVVAVAPEHNGLYTLKSSYSSHFTKESILRQKPQRILKDMVPTCFTTANRANSSPSLEVLHARLGHTSLSKMKYIPVCKNILSDTFFCDTCIQAKAHRLPFERSTISTKAPFELVHMGAI